MELRGRQFGTSLPGLLDLPERLRELRVLERLGQGVGQEGRLGNSFRHVGCGVSEVLELDQVVVQVEDLNSITAVDQNSADAKDVHKFHSAAELARSGLPRDEDKGAGSEHRVSLENLSCGCDRLTLKLRQQCLGLCQVRERLNEALLRGVVGHGSQKLVRPFEPLV